MNGNDEALYWYYNIILMFLFCCASLKTKIVVLDGKKIPKPVDVTELATRNCVGPMPSQLVRPMVELCL